MEAEHEPPNPAMDDVIVHAGIAEVEDDHDESKPSGDAPHAGNSADAQGRGRRWQPHSRHLPICASFLAVGLAAFTTWLNIHHSTKQDKATARTELTALITQLIGLEDQSAAKQSSRTLTAAQRQTDASALSEAEAVVAHSAAQLAAEVRGSASSDEYYALSTAYARLGRWDDAFAMTTAGLRVAASATDRLNLRRERGHLDLIAGSTTDAEREYRAALSAYAGVRTFVPYESLEAAVATEIGWARGAAAAGECGMARAQAQTAWDAEAALPSVAAIGYRSSLKTMAETVGACPGTGTAGTVSSIRRTHVAHRGAARQLAIRRSRAPRVPGERR